MSSQAIALTAIVTTIANLVGMVWVVVKVAFLAGTVTQKVEAIEGRVDRLENQRDQQSLAARAAAGR